MGSVSSEEQRKAVKAYRKKLIEEKNFYAFISSKGGMNEVIKEFLLKDAGLKKEFSAYVKKTQK